MLSNVSGNNSSYHKTRIGRDYYDEVADAKRRDTYYQGLSDTFTSSEPGELFQKLHGLLEKTHRPLSELPGEILYSEVDRRPDGALYYLYSGQGPKNEDQVTERNNRDLENYNLEHLVPKAWFDAEQPMRDDLHHLFTEQRQCNSLRGDLPLREVEGYSREIDSCGLIREQNGPAFEPLAGKGEAARAILYFATRHPGLVGDRDKELKIQDLPKLLEWHQQYPVSDYERHRNETIQTQQGNRNPFIDFPELADKVDFSKGFAG